MVILLGSVVGFWSETFQIHNNASLTCQRICISLPRIGIYVHKQKMYISKEKNKYSVTINHGYVSRCRWWRFWIWNLLKINLATIWSAWILHAQNLDGKLFSVCFQPFPEFLQIVLSTEWRNGRRGATCHNKHDNSGSYNPAWRRDKADRFTSENIYINHKYPDDGKPAWKAWGCESCLTSQP